MYRYRKEIQKNKPAGAVRRRRISQQVQDPITSQLQEALDVFHKDIKPHVCNLSALHMLHNLGNIWNIDNNIRKLTDDYQPFQQNFSRIARALDPLAWQPEVIKGRLDALSLLVDTVGNKISDVNASVMSLQQVQPYITPLVNKFNEYGSTLDAQFHDMRSYIGELAEQTHKALAIITTLEDISKDPAILRTIEDLKKVAKRYDFELDDDILGGD